MRSFELFVDLLFFFHGSENVNGSVNEYLSTKLMETVGQTNCLLFMDGEIGGSGGTWK